MGAERLSRTHAAPQPLRAEPRSRAATRVRSPCRQRPSPPHLPAWAPSLVTGDLQAAWPQPPVALPPPMRRGRLPTDSSLLHSPNAPVHPQAHPSREAPSRLAGCSGASRAACPRLWHTPRLRPVSPSQSVAGALRKPHCDLPRAGPCPGQASVRKRCSGRFLTAADGAKIPRDEVLRSFHTQTRLPTMDKSPHPPMPWVPLWSGMCAVPGPQARCSWGLGRLRPGGPPGLACAPPPVTNPQARAALAPCKEGAERPLRAARKRKTTGCGRETRGEPAKPPSPGEATPAAGLAGGAAPSPAGWGGGLCPEDCGDCGTSAALLCGGRLSKTTGETMGAAAVTAERPLGCIGMGWGPSGRRQP